jgi:hypothetical protein
MKTNDRIILFMTAAYSYLFYEQNAGINFLIFNLLLIGVLLIRDRNLIHHKKWWFASVACILSSIAIVAHSSALAIIANIFSILVLSAYSFTTQTSLIFSVLFSGYSVVMAFIEIVKDASVRSAKNQEKNSGEKNGYRVVVLLVAISLSVLFLTIYRQSNPLFAENTKWLNLDFISFSWVLFTVSGLLVVYGLFYHKTISTVELWEAELKSTNVTNDPERVNQNTTEIFAGVLLFGFLNFMLIILNIGDINTIWFNGKLPEGIGHSDFVHNGVSLIILSIVIASTLIMFLFRKNFNALKGSNTLKLMVYFWIAQNLLMLCSTAYRNQIYIHDFNLTYKRIGVYVWIALALLGLILTLIKVYKEQSNWALIRNNLSAWFCTLVLSSVLNWDLVITRYNIKNKALTEIDFYYLFSLSDSNIPELLEITKRPDFNLVNDSLKNFTNSSQSYYKSSYKKLMVSKIKYYLKDYKNDWQSWDLRDRRIMNHLIK